MLNKFTITLCCVLAWSQMAMGQSDYTNPDTICIFADNPFYPIPVTQNDPFCNSAPPPMPPCFVISPQTECVYIDPQGFIKFTGDPKECCGVYTLFYRLGNLTQSPLTRVDITVKCPKPDCNFVELEPPSGGTAGGGNPVTPPCINACEFSTSTYFIKHTVGNTYTWNVVGGTFTVIDSGKIDVVWGPVGAGVISVTVTNGNTVNTFVFCVDILLGPTASFTKSDSIFCLSANVSFLNTSLNATSYYWDFGDGSFSTAVNPSHIYTTPGMYWVTLIATKDNYGPNGEALCCCSDTMTMKITIDDKPGPDILWVSTLCEGDSSKYWTTATGCNFTWTVEDANGNPVTFSGQGNDTICVVWGSGPYGVVTLQLSGCIPNIYCTLPVSVNVPIIQSVSIISGPKTVCPGDKATYELPKWMSVLYHWNVMGGMLVSADTNAHTITIMWGNTAPSMGMITATYESKFLNDLPNHEEGNECSGMATLKVNILPKFGLNNPPTLVCVGDVTSLTASPAAPNGFTWTGPPSLGFPIVGPSSISVTWANTGFYTICATPNAPNPFCNTKVCRSFNVMTIPPPDSITGPMKFCPGDTLYYFGHSTEFNKKFKWTVTGGMVSGGGTMFTGNPLIVILNATGPYSISLTQMMINDPMCMSTAIIKVPMKKTIQGPLVISGSSACINALNNYGLLPLQDPDAIITWSLSNPLLGSIINQGSPNIQVQWNNTPGPVTLTCTISLCGVTQAISKALILTNLSVTINQIGLLCPGVTAILNANAPPGATYAWSTGSLLQTTSISLAGTYTVTATLNGCTSVASFTASNAPLPVASISTPDVTGLCIPGGSVVIFAMTNPSYSYMWTCNGGPVVAPAFVTMGHTLTHPNTNVVANFTYQVKVTDTATGCMNTSNIITVVQDSCLGGGQPGCSPQAASISVNYGNPTCNEATFIPTPNFTAISWNFADPPFNNATYTGPLQTPTHTYTTAGCRVVYATGTVPNTAAPPVPPTCLITIPVSVCIPLAPRFNFSNSCDTFCFNDLSTVLPGHTIVNRIWDFGDGSPLGSGANPCHVYASSGPKSVMLTVISAAGCVVSITLPIIVPVKPNCAFTLSKPVLCINEDVQFVPSFTTNIISYFWTFGDGSNNGGQSPFHAYTTSGPKIITLTMTDIYGCTCTSMQTVMVHPMFSYGPIMVDDKSICQGDTATLTSPLAASYLWSNGATTQVIQVTTAGTYSVTVTDVNGCKKEIEGVEITVLPLPVATISGSHFICDTDCITLIGNQEPNAMYNWLDESQDTIAGQIANTIMLCYNNYYDTIYYKIKDANGCIGISGPWYIQLDTSPVVNIIANDTLCEGTPNLLQVSPILPGVRYLWNTGATTTAIVVILAGTYTVIATDTISGCSNSATTIVHPLPDLCYVPTGCYKVCSPFKLCGPEGLAMYQWCFNGANIMPGGNMSMLMATQAGIYNLKGYTSYGCVDTSDALILETMLCCEDSDSEVTADTIPGEGCCFSFNYYLGVHPLYAVTLTALNANMNINFPSILAGYQIIGSSANSVTIANANTGMPLDTGNVSGLIDLCFNGFNVGGVDIVINWYDSLEMVICMDTLHLDCDPDGDCVFIASDTMICDLDLMVYQFTICNPVSASYPIGYFVLNPLTPSGLGPFPFNLSPALLPGQCTTLVVTFNANLYQNQYLCYSITAHEQNPEQHPDALCCALDSLHCIFIPGCDPCDSVYVHGVEQVAIGEDSCCYAIVLNNYGQPNVYTGVNLCVITTGQTINMNTASGTNWIPTLYTPTLINLDFDGDYLLDGYETLPTICVGESDLTITKVEIKWIGPTGTICRDTVSLQCSDCGLMEYEVICKEGNWFIQMTITNNTPNVVSSAYIKWCNPALAGYNLNVFTGSLGPNQSFGPFTVPIGAPATPNSINCVKIILHDEEGLSCCEIESDVLLPNCDTQAEQCLCNLDFEKEVDKGIMCTNVGPVYTFKPLGTFDPECDKVVWEIQPLGVTLNSVGMNPVNFTFSLPGEYQICMIVIRHDVNGKECKAKFIKQINVDPVAPPSIYPNPSSSRIVLKTDAEYDKASTIQIYSREGHVVYSKDMIIDVNKFSIDILELPAGFYIIKMTNAHRQWTSTFIKTE